MATGLDRAAVAGVERSIAFVEQMTRADLDVVVQDGMNSAQALSQSLITAG